jgi:hypothetical protein
MNCGSEYLTGIAAVQASSLADAKAADEIIENESSDAFQREPCTNAAMP